MHALNEDVVVEAKKLLIEELQSIEIKN